jgi:clan AA aspartic protease
MGVIRVTAAIRNPADPDRVWEGLFLVDTGATDCLVPRQHLESIGLVPEGQRICGLAAGSEFRMDIAVGRIKFMGEFVGGTIVFGEANAEPPLGVTALESVGIEVNPHNQTLQRLPSTQFRGFRTRP